MGGAGTVGQLTRISREEAEGLAKRLPDWTLEGDKCLVRTFEFRDFRDSMRFINRVAELAEQEDHHPDITISFNKVRIELSTHKLGGLSKKDFYILNVGFTRTEYFAITARLRKELGL